MHLMKNRVISLIVVTVLLMLSVMPSISAKQATIPTAEEIMQMSVYDGREYGIVTPVKDQGTSNLCWAYSSIAASETSILRLGIDPDVDKNSLSFNPVAAAYRIYRRESDPLGNTNGDWQSVDYTKATGNPLKIAKIFSLWWGPVSGSQANINPFENPTYRFENAFHIPENKANPAEGILAIKKAIAQYGAVTFQYNNMRECEYYNPKNESGSSSSPHACTIVGWNDNIPAEKFIPGGASQNGGWLVKNSYSSCEYFWLSYDNTSSSAYAFTYAPKDKYDFNYCYDGNLEDFSLRKDKCIANVYQAKKGGTNGKSEFLKAVNVAVQGENITVETEIIKNLDAPYNGQSNVPVSGGASAGKTTRFFEHGGYVTVELNEPVRLENGEWFSVIVRVSNNNGDAKIVTGYRDRKDLSYVPSGDNWYTLGYYVGRIKAYTALIGCENPNDHIWSAPTVTKEPTAAADGESIRTCTVCGETEKTVIKRFAHNCSADDSIIYGLKQGIASDKFQDYFSSDYAEISLTVKGEYIGTGTVVKVTYPDKSIKEYTVVIFGDLDGDGLHDGRDAVLAQLIASGMLSPQRAVLAAADINRDGKIDSYDVDKLVSAGLFMSEPDQIKAPVL